MTCGNQVKKSSLLYGGPHCISQGGSDELHCIERVQSVRGKNALPQTPIAAFAFLTTSRTIGSSLSSWHLSNISAMTCSASFCVDLFPLAAASILRKAPTAPLLLTPSSSLSLNLGCFAIASA